jgi:hypothetical protein
MIVSKDLAELFDHARGKKRKAKDALYSASNSVQGTIRSPPCNPSSAILRQHHLRSENPVPHCVPSARRQTSGGSTSQTSPVPAARPAATRKRLGATAPVSATVRRSLQLDWNRFNSSMGMGSGPNNTKLRKWGEVSESAKRKGSGDRSKSDSPPPPLRVRSERPTTLSRDLPIRVLSAGRGLQDWDSGGLGDAVRRQLPDGAAGRTTYPSSFVID